MSIEDLEGATYGPYPYRTDPEKVSEFAAVVGVEESTERVPHSLAGALLFCVAPHLLADERAGEATRSVIHGDQGFTWQRPIPLGAQLSVTGTVSRVRVRGGVYFTSFQLDVTDAVGPVLTGTSTFLMSGNGATPAAGGEERPEPDPAAGSVRESKGVLGDEPSALGRFAASRRDLVQYAGASRDWNPIHWDHAAAVAAGLPGIVVHGLLQSAWVIDTAARLGVGVTSARFRYRRPLGAAVTAELVGSRTDTGAAFELGDDGGPFLTATLG